MQDIRNVLWTSGWDSSFRLLYSVIVEDVVVRPIYILDRNRESSINEIKAIDSIRSALRRKFPEKFNNLLPLKLLFKSDVEDRVYKSYLSDLEQLEVKFGTQHAWLPIVLEKYSSSDIFELCMHAPSPQSKFVNQYAKLNSDGIKVLSENSPEHIKKLFSCFSFPVIDIEKKEFEKVASKYGFDDILYLTWFCHGPVFNKPCGICSPCKDARNKYGMRHRLSFLSLWVFPGVKIFNKVVLKLFRRKL